MIITYCDVIRHDHCHHWMEVTQKRQLFIKLIIKSCRTMNSYYSISYIFVDINKFITAAAKSPHLHRVGVHRVYKRCTVGVFRRVNGLVT